MPDTQPPPFPGSPDGPNAAPTPSVPPVSDYGTPPPQQPQAYRPSAQYASTQYPAAPYAPGTISPKKGPSGLAVSSLFIGGMALFLSFIPILNYLTGFVAFVGLVLGVIAIFLKGRKKTLAIVASSVSLLALILSIVFSIVYTNLILGSANSAGETRHPAATSQPFDPVGP